MNSPYNSGYKAGFEDAKHGLADDWNDPDEFVTDLMVERGLSYPAAQDYVNGYDNGIAAATIDAA